MKKSLMLIILTVLLMPFSSAVGQEYNSPEKKIFRYQGEFNITGGVAYGYYNFGADLLTGLRFNPYLFTGIGIGLEYGIADWTAPIYINVKGYVPVGCKTNLYLGTDVGMKCLIGNMVKRFYVGPEFGVNFEFGKRIGMNIALKYEMLANTDVYVSERLVEHSHNSFGVMLGLVF